MNKLSTWRESNKTMEQLSDNSLESVFSRLKPYCVDLLGFLQNPKRSAPFLLDMADFLRRAPPQALQPSLDYTMFPLLLLLDAAVQCRSGTKAEAPIRRIEISDSVAEGVLLCIEELLKKCHLGSVDQMVVLLKKLTYGALLSPNESAEEFREGIIRCFRALIFRIQPCSSRSCSCKEITLPNLISKLEAQYCISIMHYPEPEECLLAFLQSQSAAAAVGHWLSLLLQIAEAEVARGQRGSSSLRREALLTLRVLVAKVGSADALAFFLPGIVSRFSKALHLTKNMISGAAGSTGSIEHAVLGLSEFLMIVLNDEANLDGLQYLDASDASDKNKKDLTQSVLDTLRCLPVLGSENLAKDFNHQTDTANPSQIMAREDKECPSGRNLHVCRTREWIDKTSENVDKLLSATFPHLAIHPAEKIRRALVEGITGLLTNCCCILKRSKLMLLETLCVLICDDSVAVSTAAHESLESLFMMREKFLKENEIAELFTSLVEKLPRVVLGSEEMVAISHARRLLALMYYGGPETVFDHLLSSPAKAAQFLEYLRLSLSHNSQFAGPVNKLILSKPLSVGYLLSVAELKAGAFRGNATHDIGGVAPSVPRISMLKDEDWQHPGENADTELPRMPPWFVNIGSEKLYVALAGILRLSGLSTVAEHRIDACLSVIVDILLDSFRKLILELRMKDYNKEGWQAWYTRGGYGQLLRQTSSAICMLNEITFGLSDQSIVLYSKLFRKGMFESECREGTQNFHGNIRPTGFSHDRSSWKVWFGRDVRDHIIHCIGSILHEYTSPEVWALPADQNSPLLEHDTEGNLSLHFFRDVTMLHQVIIEGIGVFSMVLGKEFISSGFMHSTLYLLLQNLICSSSQIRSASDAVLQVLSSTTGHASVGHLVVANADYIVDSLCRQLRHLDLNPHVPDVFAAMLSYIGVAHEILPLLDEPIRSVSLELEVLGRHQHPHLTIPFLKAVSEITKASRFESCKLPSKAEAFHAHVAAKSSSIHEHMDEVLSQLNSMRRYRRIVGFLAASCLSASFPLLSSMKELACLLALNIVEDVTVCLAKVEEAYKHEKQAKVSIEEAIKLSSMNDFEDSMDVEDADADENRLLPAMNKIWPYLMLSMKNKVSLAVINKCTRVISSVILVCGGDFFIRRFHTDGPVIWKLLASSPFHKKTGRQSETQILLPYRNNSLSEDPMAEASNLKIQIAILNLIAELSSNKRSASAVESVLKKVAGLVVGIACSSVTGLRDAAVKALRGLSCIDPDLIWLLVADVYFSMKSKERSETVVGVSGLHEMGELLPPPLSPKDYLYVQYGGESSGFDLDTVAVEVVFRKVQSGDWT